VANRVKEISSLPARNAITNRNTSCLLNGKSTSSNSTRIPGAENVSSHTFFLDQVFSTIQKNEMLRGEEKILVGLSGGPDSVCLLHVLHRLRDRLNLDLNALYIDHGLRPHETGEEIEFCRQLSEGLSVDFLSTSIDVKTYAKEHGFGIQEAARELRYMTFERMAYNSGAKKIALGHTVDDQMETFFMRIFRGSGPKGLSGIPPVRGMFIRPLLDVDRECIERYLNEEQVRFIMDSSNLKKDYLRNKLRLVLMPEMKKIAPHIAQSIARMADILREEEKYFEILIAKTLMKLISRKTDARIELFLSPLEAMDRVILRRVLRKALAETRGLRGIEFIHIESIIQLVKHGRQGDRIYLPGGIRAIKDYATLVLTSEIPATVSTYILNVPGKVVLKEIGVVIKASIEQTGEQYGNGKTTAVFDAGKTGTELTVRSRKKGDFFYPLGFGKKKKLQDYFVDEKVPRDERSAVPLVVAGDDIVWIAGYRGDERFKVSQTTERFLKIELHKTLR
jgi:tRNA(Ile)-lysidine synthase